MAWVYQPEYFDDGDIAAPEPWNVNMTTFASEFNGYLDRDNIPDGAIDYTRIAARACGQVYSFSSTGVSNFDSTKLEWQNGSGGSFGRLEFTADVDGVVVVEWSGTWASTPTSGWSDLSWVRFRITVNGVEVAQTGWFDCFRVQDFTYLVGAIPVSPGPVVIQVQGKGAQVVAGSVADRRFVANENMTLQMLNRDLVAEYLRR